MKIYGRNNLAAAKNISLFVEGDSAARIEFPAIIALGNFLLKDGSNADVPITFDHIAEKTSGHNVIIDNKIRIDQGIGINDIPIPGTIRLRTSTNNVNALRILDNTITQILNVNTVSKTLSGNADLLFQVITWTGGSSTATNAHIADNSQAHSDYLKNNASDSSSGTITAANFSTSGSVSAGSYHVGMDDGIGGSVYGASSSGGPTTLAMSFTAGLRVTFSH